MKRINEYKKLFNVEKDIDLKQLKSTYRNLVKEWHPDKFQADDEQAAEAELKSRQIIDGYHFLVSIAPETQEKVKEEYLKDKENTLLIASKNSDKNYLNEAIRNDLKSNSKFQDTKIAHSFSDGLFYFLFSQKKNKRISQSFPPCIFRMIGTFKFSGIPIFKRESF
jgi:DnaJ-class molecular chaperone